MKVKSILAAVMLLSALTASQALADSACQLTVNPSSYVRLGQWFSYDIFINGRPHVGPWPPPNYTPPGPPFTVVFQGTNIAGGEFYPGTFSWGHSDLTGYQNPSSGGFSGTYLRYAVVYDSLGRYYCETDTIAVVLE